MKEIPSRGIQEWSLRVLHAFIGWFLRRVLGLWLSLLSSSLMATISVNMCPDETNKITRKWKDTFPNVYRLYSKQFIISIRAQVANYILIYRWNIKKIFLANFYLLPFFSNVFHSYKIIKFILWWIYLSNEKRFYSILD